MSTKIITENGLLTWSMSAYSATEEPLFPLLELDISSSAMNLDAGFLLDGRGDLNVEEIDVVVNNKPLIYPRIILGSFPKSVFVRDDFSSILSSHLQDSIRFISCNLQDNNALKYAYHFCIIRHWVDLGLKTDWPMQASCSEDIPDISTDSTQPILKAPIFSGNIPSFDVFGVYNYGPLFISNSKWVSLKRDLQEDSNLFDFWALQFK